MKFFTYDTAAAFERPSVRGWLLVFVCGFLTACILAAVACILLWLFGMGAMALKGAASSAPLDVSLSSVARGILQIAAVFGILLATLMVLFLASRRRQEAQIPGHHPTIGDFQHLPFYKTWHAKPVLPTGQTVRLSAYGSGPSAAQAALWEKFIAQYDDLVAAATQSLLNPPHPLEACETITLTPSGITLSQDGRLHLGFEFTATPKNLCTPESDEPYPTASFTSALELKSTEWLQTYG